MSDQIRTLPDLDKNAFEVLDEPNFIVARRVTVSGAVAGSFSPSGLKVAFKNTTLDTSTTAIPLPATPLAQRNSIVVYNLSTTQILYIGNSDVTADVVNGTTSGWQIEPGSYFSTDITPDIILYGVYSTGTHKVQVLELA